MISLITGIALAGAAATVQRNISMIDKAKLASSNDPETLVIPSEKNRYFTPDIRLKLTLPSKYLHQRGEEWKSPLNSVNFALNLKDYSATKVTPIEDSSIIVVDIGISAYDGVNNLVKDFIRIRHTDKGQRWGKELETQRYGLNYYTTIEYPGAPPNEFLFDNEKFHKTMIRCRPSGNAYPSLCTISIMDERGAGKNPDANATVLTEIIFRQDRLAEWKEISQQVAHFLQDKIEIVGWEK